MQYFCQIRCKDAITYAKCSKHRSYAMNPSIGGPAKGVVVRELAALGGIMGDVADESFLQTKILNTKKGPGVWAIRNQIDKKKYQQKIKKLKN